MNNFTYDVDTNIDATDTRSEAKKKCDAAFEADKKGLLSTPDVYDVQTSRPVSYTHLTLPTNREV